ncbi:MAG TPA: HEAT repeat domain-containing protein [Candidatus Acidoferrales bacterium]|nr:HEAT repeat domain-containing protein [Candidatus Acidoferrales bacterium]
MRLSRFGPAVAPVLASFVLAGALTAADQPKFVNARVETRSINGSLEATVQSVNASETAAVWIGYALPTLPPRDGESRSMCCGDHYNGQQNCGPCLLEEPHGTNISTSDHVASGGTVKLEGPQEMFVLLRAADHRIGKVHTFTEDCQLDAGGLRVIWLTDAKPAESVAMLAKIVTTRDFADRDEREPANGALVAIALTSDPSVDKTLESFVSSDRPEKLRSETAFWMGTARGAAGIDGLKRMAKSDASTKVREQVTFALSVSREPGSIEEMIRMAHDDESTQVRGQALFWLGQKAGQRAAGAITEAIENDPDTEVKKKAVFALSQLPKDQGVPMLIQVARTNKNPVVRKQAMFWLGQSRDPRALEFFEEVLTGGSK